MNRTALILITSDPRTSPRAAEGVRVAAGVGAWKKVSITLYLRGAAVLCAGEFADELADGDTVARCMPMLGGAGRPVYAEAGNPFLGELGDGPVCPELVDDAGLARLVAEHDFVLRF
jgi:hypothetical protein